MGYDAVGHLSVALLQMAAVAKVRAALEPAPRDEERGEEGGDEQPALPALTEASYVGK